MPSPTSLLFTSPSLFSLAKLIYSLPYPQPPAPTESKSLEVLCLGLPRSGTDSLRTALKILGHNGVSHGFEFWLHFPEDSLVYAELASLRLRGTLPHDGTYLRTRYFDRVLGRSEAQTDIPGVWFSKELLRAYPDAKVVLNKRDDVGEWKRSFRESVLPLMESWRYWVASWFQAELFWGMAITYYLHGSELFEGDFEGNAERAYVRHYERLERELELEGKGRRVLRWGVKDGWEPLCEFLGKPIPAVEFPKGNVAAEFGPKLMAKDKERIRIADRNAVIFFSTLVALIRTVTWFLWV